MLEKLNKSEQNNQSEHFDSNEMRHDFGNVFSYYSDPIVIDEVPDDIPLDQTRTFYKLLVQYNKFYDEKFQPIHILDSQSRFRSFYDFVFANALAGRIQVKEIDISVFIDKLRALQDEYNQNLKSVDRYYDEIVDRLYHPRGYYKNDEKVRKAMYMFMSAYTLMKQAFDGKERETTIDGDQNERYFTHLKGVMEIVLRELPGANIERVVLALLHDVLEDIPGYSFETLNTIYGEYIANGVEFLSKKDWLDYLSEDEKKKYDDGDEKIKNGLKYRAKERRNIEYFGHLIDLEDDYLAVKLADRIHNLRTMDIFSNKKIKFKLRETEKYFLIPEIKDRMPEAYALIEHEVDELRKQIK